MDASGIGFAFSPDFSLILRMFANFPVNPELLEQPAESELETLCFNVPWIGSLLSRTLESADCDLDEFNNKPPIEVAAFFNALMPTGTQLFGAYASRLSAREISQILIELLSREPDTFLQLMVKIDPLRITAVMEELRLLDRGNFYPLILSALTNNEEVNPNATWVLKSCSEELRHSIALEFINNPLYICQAFDIFTEYEDFFYIYNEILNCPHIFPTIRNYCLSRCLEKMLPHWLHARPASAKDIFYKVNFHVFVKAIGWIVMNPMYSPEMRSLLLNALEWDRIYALSENDPEAQVALAASLLILAIDFNEAVRIMDWLESKHRFSANPHVLDNFVEVCINQGLCRLLAYLILRIDHRRFHLFTRYDNEIKLLILANISRVPDDHLLPLVSNCCRVLIDFVLGGIKFPFRFEYAGEPMLLSETILTIMKDSQDHLDGPCSFVFQRLPRIFHIFAMRHQQASRHLIACYNYLSEQTMREIENYLPEEFLTIPSMLPYIGEMRCNLLAKMQPSALVEVCAKTNEAANTSILKVQKAKRLLEIEVGKKTPNVESLKSLCTEYQKVLNQEGDIDPGLRRFLKEKGENDALLDKLEILFTFKQTQLCPTGLIAQAQRLIHAPVQAEAVPENELPPAEECLTPYIFNIITKKEWPRLELIGIKSDQDLRVIGLDPHTQQIVEEYREELAKCFDIKERHGLITLWRDLYKCSQEELQVKVALIVSKMNKAAGLPVPRELIGMSSLIPARDEIRNGSWEEAVLWVVKASAHYIWQKYSSQDNLEETWKKWEDMTLATIGLTKSTDLLNLSRIQSKKHKSGE